MLDRKQMLLLADNKFKDGVYADETLELVDRCIEIVNEESSEFEFNEFEDDPRINSSLRRVKYKKFLKIFNLAGTIIISYLRYQKVIH